ncbi:MAG: hypothetical protein ONB30_01390 [candidate division KSB1 bacterium]|nr:hypothetical protein [candidate division KSB1 bacterium]MDZ7295031.1 hypothetical protein [candidate division KSB1 bacterium]MDZ7337173.1 hypothetical protein [candidate division KSB1 bacterium]MDZ7385475.1 hypothetical protein [candidate division KSB1 bacterium]MDZ7391824.1 hypothetical protein [candidate division KSB1 bacterium]
MQKWKLRGAAGLCASVILLWHWGGANAGGPIYGGGGGPFVTFKAFESTGMDQLARVVGVPCLASWMRGAGGAGYAFIGSARIGGLGGAASVRSSALVAGQERSLKVDFGYGGFLAEYVSRYRRLTTSAGCVLGGGAYEVQIEDENGTHKASRGFFCLQPCAGLRVQLVHFVALQAWASYLFPVAEDLSIRYGSALYHLTAGEMGGLAFLLGLEFGGNAP